MAEGGWKQSPVVAAVAVIALIVAGYFIFSRMGGGGGGSVFIGDKYFLDMTSGELITSDSSKSPIQTSDSHEAVRAHVFSCTSCDDQASRFIGYLRSFTPAALAAMDMPAEQREPFIIESGTLISGHSPDAGWKPAWVPAESAQGMSLQEVARAKCGDSYAECMPR
jgi:hypothetical protein